MINLPVLLHECVPTAAPQTVAAVVRTESNFNPLAININGGTRLTRQPQSAEEATSWAIWLGAHGYSIDVGLMQINNANLRRMNLDYAAAFDPCTNLRVGTAMLTANYQRGLQSGYAADKALYHALSAYNTGDFNRGLRNGYVNSVLRAAGVAPQLIAAPVAARFKKPRHGQPVKTVVADAAPSPYTAETGVTGFGKKTAFE